MLVMPWASDSTQARSPSLSPEVPLAHRVKDTLLASILSGEFAPGDRITEPEVAERLKVSRVPVREALRELETAGLLESRKHIGVFVRTLSTKETADLYVLRSLLEAHTCRVAAERSDPALIVRLMSLINQMEDASTLGDLSNYYNGNLAFHWAIVAACGNAQITQTYQGIVQKLHMARLTNLSSSAGMKHSQREHRAILLAIRGEQALEANDLAAKHVLDASDRFTKGEPL
jgi:DNA-binding GntR family transcriptional regulator